MNDIIQPQTKTTLTQSWKYETGSLVISDILSADTNGEQMTIVMTAKEELIAFSLEGEVLWKQKFGRSHNDFLDTTHIRNSCSSPVFKNSVIYVGSQDGNLYAISGKGKRLWQYPTGDEINSTPAILKNGNVVFGSNDNHIYQVDDSGKLVWKRCIGYPIESRIVSDQIDGVEKIFFGASDNHLYAYDTHGNLEWKFQTEGNIIGGVGIGDIDNSGKKSIIGGSNDSFIYSLSSEGVLNWKRDTGGVITSDIQLTELRKGKLDILMGVCSPASNVQLISGKNSLIDSFDAGYWVSSAPLVHNGNVVFGSSDHNLYIISWDSGFGKQTYMFDTGDIVVSRPAIVGGKIVCVNKSGSVYCITHS